LLSAHDPAAGELDATAAAPTQTESAPLIGETTGIVFTVTEMPEPEVPQVLATI
jgi:hypothetical protein